MNPISWLKRAWAYSRTIVVNVLGTVLLLLPELIQYLLNVDFEGVVGHKYSVVIGLALTVANMILRIYTVAPVGASANAKIAAVNIVADVADEESKK